MNVRAVLGIALAALSVSSARAEYPDRTVTIVTPYAAGGPSDALARELAAHLQKAMGKTFIVDNKPGAGGTIATSFVARANPDGYTLLLTSTSNQLMLPEVMKKRPYDGIGDFTPIIPILQYPFLLVGKPQGPSTVQELIAKGKAGDLNWGSFGVGGGNHLVGSYFVQSLGIKAVHIPYKGSAASTLALASGEIDFVFDSYLAVAGQVAAGKIKPLAVSTRARMAALPAVPTLAESGLKSFDESIWQAIVGPKGIPPAIVSALNAEMNRYVSDPEVRARMEKQGAAMMGGSSEAFRKTMQSDGERWKRFIIEHDIRIEE